MSSAVAALCHPLASYAGLLLSVVAALYAAQSRSFAPALACLAASLVVAVSFLQVPPSLAGIVWLGVALAFLHAEFLWPTFGAAALFGIGSAAWGSFLLLAALDRPARLAAALVGAMLLLAAVARTMRLRTLPRYHSARRHAGESR